MLKIVHNLSKKDIVYQKVNIQIGCEIIVENLAAVLEDIGFEIKLIIYFDR